MAKFSTGSSRAIVDLRKRKPGAHTRPFSFREPPRRSSSSPERLRTRRRRFRVIGALAAALVLLAAAYGASWASYLPAYSIQDIRVSGTSEVPGELVRSYVETRLHDGRYSFLSRSNIFFYPRASIERAIVEYFPRIQSVKVSRESLLATAITVLVEERATFAKWCSDDACYFIGNGGFVFASASSSAQTASGYVFRGGISSTTSAIGQQYLPGNFAGVLALLERLGQAGYPAREIIAKDSSDFTVRLQRGFEVRASYGADVGALVKNLELILASEPLRGKENALEYVDLRFGNRVYFKLKGESATTAIQ